MTNNELENVDPEIAGENKKNSKSIRLWHWANLIAISGSLITVLINSTITNGYKTGTLIQDELQKAGAQITKDQARSVAHALSDKVWDIHVYFGYGLAALFLFRIMLEFFQIADQKFIRGIKKAYIQYKTIKLERQAAIHDLGVKITYSVFYILLLIMVTTGLFLAFEDAMAPFKAIRHSVKDFHGFCMYLIIAFILAHVIGVFIAEHNKKSKGLVSDMINGGS